MPPISGVSHANLAALNRVLVQVGKGMDADSPAAQKLDDKEAAAVIGELNQLDPSARAEVSQAIASLMRDEFIQVTGTGRKAFADALGVSVQALSPNQTAEIAGLTQARTAFAASMQALSKTPQMKGAKMKNIVAGLKEFVPPEGQKYLAAILGQASSDGVFKMDTNARKEFRKFVGALDKGGEVTEAKQAFEAKRTDHGVTSFQRALAAGGFFEDILAAFMFDLLQQIQGEVLEKAGEFDRNQAVNADSDRQHQEIQGNSMKELIKKETQTDQPKATDADVDSRVDQAQHALERLVNSVDAHKADDGKIDPLEAQKIAAKLDELGPPVDQLVADATLKALSHTDGAVSSEAIAPVVEWAVKTITEATGQPPDLTPSTDRPLSTGKDDDPVIKSLADSDKLENKIASFMLQAFVGDNLSVGEKVKKLREAKSDWGDAARNCNKMLEAPEVHAAHAGGEAGQAQTAQVAAGGAAPPGGGTEDVQAAADAQPPAPAQQAQAQQAQAQAGPQQAATTPKQASEMKTQSRQELMEELKTLQQELQQALQALSNILNMLHQNAMNSIRSIR